MLYNHVHMNTMNVSEARKRLSEIINRVYAGEEFIITRNGIPVAKISPVNRKLMDNYRKRLVQKYKPRVK